MELYLTECSHKGGGNQTLALCKYALLPTEPSIQALFGLFLLVMVVCHTGTLTSSVLVKCSTAELSCISNTIVFCFEKGSGGVVHLCHCINTVSTKIFC